MNQQTLTISVELYERLVAEAQLRGITIEQLLEEWERKDSEIRRRQEAGQRADEIFERMAAKYGMMPDSAELIREDRER
jgi:hypothetical protein